MKMVTRSSSRSLKVREAPSSIGVQGITVTEVKGWSPEK
jgi:nitrogen regulatory protein PII